MYFSFVKKYYYINSKKVYPRKLTMNKSTWTKVVKELHQAFDVLLNNQTDPLRADELRTWLFNHLANEGDSLEAINNLRVATTIAFEARTGNMPAQIIFSKILNRKKQNGDYFISTKNPQSAHMQFHMATHFEFQINKVIDDNDYKFLHEFYGSEFNSAEHPKEGYARCLSLPVYFNYLVVMDEDYSDNSLDIDDYLILNEWEENKYNIPVPFPSIPNKNNVNMRGGKPLGWITRSKEFDSSKLSSNPPLDIAKRSGIFIKNSSISDPLYYDILVLINYDVNFNQMVYQPASIHADWKGGGFVSYQQNTERYGLTYNCNEDSGLCLIERVHVAFPVITKGPDAYRHRATIVGRVDEAVQLYYSKILDETLNRFENL